MSWPTMPSARLCIKEVTEVLRRTSRLSSSTESMREEELKRYVKPVLCEVLSSVVRGPFQCQRNL